MPDYYDVISKPMDLSTMMSKIDMHQYQTGKEFLEDVDLICSNALEYNPNKDTTSEHTRFFSLYTCIGSPSVHTSVYM